MSISENYFMGVRCYHSMKSWMSMTVKPEFFIDIRGQIKRLKPYAANSWKTECFKIIISNARSSMSSLCSACGRQSMQISVSAIMLLLLVLALLLGTLCYTLIESQSLSQYGE